jgi:NAD(P)H-dependent FMN reductase
VKILGFAGSLRKDSINGKLLRASRELLTAARPDVEMTIDTIAGIPLYDGDLEADHGPRHRLRELRRRRAPLTPADQGTQRRFVSDQ